MRSPYFSRRDFCVVLIGLLFGSEASAQPAARLRVLSYNIHHGEGLDGKLDLERIAKVIRSASPDIVSLQEVDKGTERTNRVDQPAVLARLSGMQVIYARNIDHEGGEYGNAVLSKLPVELVENLMLPSIAEIEPTDEQEQRGALAVKARLASGTEFLFIATHLDHRREEKERLASAKLINSHFAETGNALPTVLAGDLNATVRSRVMNELATKWQKAGADELATVPAKTPRRQIDYILFRPADRWRVIEVRVLDEPVASDHRPIFAIMELLPAAPSR